MTINFQDLCKELQLSLTYTNEQELARLTTWCHTYVSCDNRFHGSDREQYERYLTFVNHYLTTFAPCINLNTQLTKPIATLNNMTPIQYAAYLGYDRFLARLDKSHASACNTPNSAGYTSLHLAALQGHVNAVEALLKAGALPNQLTKTDESPLHSALTLTISQTNKSDIICAKSNIFNQLLNNTYSRLEQKNTSGDTIAQLLVLNNFGDLLIQLSAKYPELFFSANNRGHYPIHTAVLNDHLGAVQQLIKMCDMAELTDGKRRTALHYAAQCGNSTMIEACATNRRSLNNVDIEHCSPLLLACRAGNLAGVKTLIGLGADIHCRTYNQSTILHEAVLSNNTDLVTWLLTHTSIDVNAINGSGEQALSYVHAHDYITDEMSNILLEHGAVQAGVSLR